MHVSCVQENQSSTEKSASLSAATPSDGTNESKEQTQVSKIACTCRIFMLMACDCCWNNFPNVHE